MRRYFIVPTLIILSLFFAQTGFSQSSKELNAIKDDIKSLKAGQESIQKELTEIKKQLKAKPAPAEFKETVVDVDGDPSKGSKDAKLALIEFSDYQ